MIINVEYDLFLFLFFYLIKLKGLVIQVTNLSQYLNECLKKIERNLQPERHHLQFESLNFYIIEYIYIYIYNQIIQSLMKNFKILIFANLILHFFFSLQPKLLNLE